MIRFSTNLWAQAP